MISRKGLHNMNHHNIQKPCFMIYKNANSDQRYHKINERVTECTAKSKKENFVKIMFRLGLSLRDHNANCFNFIPLLYPLAEDDDKLQDSFSRK